MSSIIGMPFPKFELLAQKTNAINGDIINAIDNSFQAAVKQTKPIAQQFEAPTSKKTCFNVWKYLKSNINYKKDSRDLQIIKLPARLMYDKSGDCKSYSLLTASILHNLGFDTYFRYAYYGNNKYPTHVYCVVKNTEDGNIIIDGVINAFNKEVKYNKKIDIKCE